MQEREHEEARSQSPKGIRSDLGQVLAQLSELRSELGHLHSGQAKVQFAVEALQRDLAILPSRVSTCLDHIVSSDKDREMSSEHMTSKVPTGLDHGAPSAKDRERNNQRAREAQCLPLGSAFGLQPGGRGRGQQGAHPGGFGICDVCCQPPAKMERGGDRSREVEAKAPTTMAVAPSPKPQAQQRADYAPSNVEVLSPSQATSPQLQRAPTKESTGSKREQRSKAWLKIHNQRTGGDLAGVEGWNWAHKHKSMASMDKLSRSMSITDSEVANPSLIRRIVLSPVFDNTCICLVLFSAVFQGYQVNYMAKRVLEQPPRDFVRVHYAFTVIFLTEVLMRAVALRSDFFKKDDATWNVLDAFIVSSSVLEVILEYFAWLEDEGSTGFQALRVLRVLRVVRVVRIIRVFRFFRELRMMVYSIIGCVRSLVWAITLLFIILYTMATYLTQVATDYRATVPPEDILAVSLNSTFGSLVEGIYYLFQSVSGGSDWGDVAEPLLELGWYYAVFFSLFTCFTLFAVLNIVTGVFVEGAIERAQQDKEAMIQNELDEQNANVQQLELVFKEIDKDGSGILEMKEFEILMEDPRVKAWFRTMGLQVETAKHLFRLLDLDNSCSVSSSEFVMGCLRLQGGAKNVDVATLMYENKRMMLKWTAFMEFVEDQFSELKNFIAEGFNMSTHAAAKSAGPLVPVAPVAPSSLDELEDERPSRTKSRWSTVGDATSLNLYEQSDMDQQGSEMVPMGSRAWRAADPRHGSSLNIYANDPRN
mmetsp:Transcript_27550/g.69165  ORF Transcript_27550/g.69165 Transcript_27550/m.69165 type:complete len:762 (-) Transcript_27550:120-2405(-)